MEKKQNDTSTYDAQSGFISSHIQPQNKSPINKKTKLTKQNSTATTKIKKHQIKTPKSTARKYE